MLLCLCVSLLSCYFSLLFHIVSVLSFTILCCTVSAIKDSYNVRRCDMTIRSINPGKCDTRRACRQPNWLLWRSLCQLKAVLNSAACPSVRLFKTLQRCVKNSWIYCWNLLPTSFITWPYFSRNWMPLQNSDKITPSVRYRKDEQ